MSTFIGAKCNIKALVGGFSIIHLALERENLSDQRSTVFENHQKMSHSTLRAKRAMFTL